MDDRHTIATQRATIFEIQKSAKKNKSRITLCECAVAWLPFNERINDANHEK